MADIGNRLIQLRARRVGDDRPQRTTLSSAQALDLMAKSLYPSGEKWERNRHARPFTAYALGAMEEVGATYTRVSVEEAERVGKQLVPRLAQRGIPAEFRLQGSVRCARVSFQGCGMGSRPPPSILRVQRRSPFPADRFSA